MTLVDYLKILRRRWKLIAAVTVLLAAVAYLTAPKPPPSQPGYSSTGYQATATLLQDPTSTSDINFPLIQLYIKNGAIPQAAADALGDGSTPEALSQAITLAGDANTETLTITATDPSAQRAAAIANAFANATVNYLQKSAQDDNNKSRAALQKSLDELQGKITDMNAQIAAANAAAGPNAPQDTVLTAQRDALLGEYQGLYQRELQLQSEPAEASSLDILQQAQAVPVVAPSSSFAAPKSKVSRTLLGALIGLLLGIAAALVAERFDTRLRERGAIERTFRLPVVTEVPKLKRRRNRFALAAITEPDSTLAEAFRTLRSALTLMPSVPISPAAETFDNPAPTPGAGSAGAAETAVPAPKPLGSASPQVIVVTAPSAGVGKTTTAANLAACLAEAGKSVLLIDADFRYPEAHAFFQVDNRAGLSDALAAGRSSDLTAMMQGTSVPGVTLVPAGTASWVPTRLVQHAEGIIAQARTLADVVVIDSPPLLGASEAADIAAQADSVIIVGWAGRTTTEQAERTAELLARVGAPTLGVALVTASTTVAYRSGTANQRVWPLNMADRKGSRALPRERSTRSTRGR